MANTKDMAALNNALHQQLNRLNDPCLTKEQLSMEIARTEAVTAVSKEIISNGRLLLDAAKAKNSLIDANGLPKLLGDESGEE